MAVARRLDEQSILGYVSVHSIFFVLLVFSADMGTHLSDAVAWILYARNGPRAVYPTFHNGRPERYSRIRG